MIKRIKNLEDKADNQLLTIEDQGNRQLDLINNINNYRSISFKNGTLNELIRKIRNKEIEIIEQEREFKK